MVCGFMLYHSIKKMLCSQKEHHVNFFCSKHLRGMCKDFTYYRLQSDSHRKLHICQILSQCWMQPEAQGCSSSAVIYQGMSS